MTLLSRMKSDSRTFAVDYPTKPVFRKNEQPSSDLESSLRLRCSTSRGYSAWSGLKEASTTLLSKLSTSTLSRTSPSSRSSDGGDDTTVAVCEPAE